MPDPFLFTIDEGLHKDFDPYAITLAKRKIEERYFFVQDSPDLNDWLPQILMAGTGIPGTGLFIGRHGYTGMGDFYSNTHGNTGMGFF